MSTLVQADIFFFITSVAVILLTLGVLVILYYIIGITRDLRDIVARVRKAGESIEQDFEALRANVREEGIKSKALVDIVLGFAMRKLTSMLAKKSKKKSPSSEE